MTRSRKGRKAKRPKALMKAGKYLATCVDASDGWSSYIVVYGGAVMEENIPVLVEWLRTETVRDWLAGDSRSRAGERKAR